MPKKDVAAREVCQAEFTPWNGRPSMYVLTTRSEYLTKLEVGPLSMLTYVRLLVCLRRRIILGEMMPSWRRTIDLVRRRDYSPYRQKDP